MMGFLPQLKLKWLRFSYILCPKNRVGVESCHGNFQRIFNVLNLVDITIICISYHNCSQSYLYKCNYSQAKKSWRRWNLYFEKWKTSIGGFTKKMIWLDPFSLYLYQILWHARSKMWLCLQLNLDSSAQFSQFLAIIKTLDV